MMFNTETDSELAETTLYLFKYLISIYNEQWILMG